MRKKSVYSTKKTNPPLYSLSNEELATRNKNSNNENLRKESGEILRLRHNIDVLSRHAYVDEQPPRGIIDENEFSKIIFGFESFRPSHSLMFLSNFDEMGGKSTTFPISLYLGIYDATTLEEIKKGWAEIKHWRNYLHHAEGDKNLEIGGNYLFDLHTKNMAGTGYGGLAKEINQRIEKLLSWEASNKKWIKKFEKELHSYLSKKDGNGNKKTSHSSRGKKKEAGTILSKEPPSSDFSRIRQNFQLSYAAGTLERKKRWLDEVYQETPLKCLNSIPEKHPYINLELEALAILSNLGYTKEQGEERIKTALQAITEGRTMKNIVTNLKVRETLRWWRNKYGHPSPGGAGLG